jgi:tetratricopeptide (TPR) repeat protein
LRESALEAAEQALAEFADLGPENPTIIELELNVARAAVGLGNYDLALAAAERVVIVGERLALTRTVAEALVVKGIVYFYGGRLWEARAVLEGARIIARNFGLPDVELRAIHNLGLGLALDDPRAAVELEKDGLALARRLGERALEVILTGNVTEDARRTGDWAWALGELENAIGLDIDIASRRAIVLVRASYHAYCGEVSEADLAEMTRSTEGFEDLDVDASVQEVRAAVAIAEGRWRDAHDGYQFLADKSLLNAPYVVPSMGLMAVLARDPALARTAIDRLQALGTRGRATEANRTALLAGIAALDGDKAAALSGFRQALASQMELGVPFDAAIATMAAISCLGADDPETAGWAARAGDFFSKVGAAPLEAQLRRIVDGASADVATRKAAPAADGAAAAAGGAAAAAGGAASAAGTETRKASASG